MAEIKTGDVVFHRPSRETWRTKRTDTVCAACLRASCWQGIFYCDEAKDAGTVEKTRAELEALALESPDYWRWSKADGD